MVASEARLLMRRRRNRRPLEAPGEAVEREKNTFREVEPALGAIVRSSARSGLGLFRQAQ